MKARFLCAPHRAQMANNPVRAMGFCQNSFDTGQGLRDQGMFKEALPYLGNAFETAEIILSCEPSDKKQVCSLFANSAILFANTLTRLRFSQQAFEIYWMVINRLERELVINATEKDLINDILGYFYQSVQGQDYLGSPSDLDFMSEEKSHASAIQ